MKERTKEGLKKEKMTLEDFGANKLEKKRSNDTIKQVKQTNKRVNKLS